MDRPLLLSQNASKSCRICLDDNNPADLISPCLCKGGSAYVHRKCLDNWRSLNKDGRAFKYCDVCRFEYVIESVVDDPSADRKRLLIFRLLVTRDILLIILLVQAIIIAMTFLLQAADKNDNAIKNLYPTSMNSFGIYYLSSLILFFAFLGVFGLISYCCGLGRNDNDNDDRCDCACYGCFCVSSDCNGNQNCGGGDGGGILVVLLVIVLAFAVFGVFVGIFLSGKIIRKIIKRHMNKLWLRQETKKYIVKDLQGRTDGLTNRSTPHSMIRPSIHMKIDNNTTHKTPSAPIESLSLTTYNTQEVSTT